MCTLYSTVLPKEIVFTTHNPDFSVGVKLMIVKAEVLVPLSLFTPPADTEGLSVYLVQSTA